VDTFKRQNFGAFNIGVQMRMMDGNPMPEGLSDVAFACARSIEAALPEEYKGRVRMFLASDNEDFRRRYVRSC
jgi:hypothetical protein